MIPLIAKGRGETDGDTRDCNYFFGIRATDGVLAADFEDMATGANHPVVGTTPVSSNVWHHVAVSYDGTTWRLYLDGQLDATLAANATPRFDSIQHFGLGTAMNSTGVAAGFFDGVIDEARVWNHARSLAQIQAGMTAPITSASGLVGRWGLDEGSGTVAANSAARARRTAQIIGATFVTPGSPFGLAHPTRADAGCAGRWRHQRRQASLAQRARDGPRLGDAQRALLRADRRRGLPGLHGRRPAGHAVLLRELPGDVHGADAVDHEQPRRAQHRVRRSRGRHRQRGDPDQPVEQRRRRHEHPGDAGDRLPRRHAVLPVRR